MALDGIFLSSIVYELRKEILDAKIDKVNQPEKDELLITIRGKKNYKLLISSNSSYPRIHLTEINKANPMQPPMFCMVLRKYLTNGRIKDIYQIHSDRILCIDISNTDELGFDSIYTLIIEIMGRHSNITLVRSRDNKIMDCIKHITPDINSYRTLLPGIDYKYPPESVKLNPFNFKEKEAVSFLEEKNIKLDKNFYFNTFTGISKVLSKDLYLRADQNSDIDLSVLFEELQIFIEAIKNNEYKYVIYYNGSVPLDFYCHELSIYKEYNSKSFTTPWSLLDAFYFEKDKQDRIKSKTQDIEKLISTNLDRCYKKIDILNQVLEEGKEKEDYRIKGELLTANIYSITPGIKKIKLWNYYSENDEYVEIELDTNLSPSENIQKYYKRYNKLKKSETSAKEQLEHTKQEIHYLTSVLNSISNIENYEEIDEIREELIESGYIRFRKNKKKNKPTKPHHFVSSEGADIHVGKNNIQNDNLTLRFAGKNDTWLHTKNIPGSL